LDSVVAFFRSASFEEVEQTARELGFHDGMVSGSREHFHMHRIAQDQIESELDGEELARLRALMGGDPASAFIVSCRHGDAARFASETLAAVMAVHEPSVIDDDFGSLWTAAELLAHLASSEYADLFSLRRPEA